MKWGVFSWCLVFAVLFACVGWFGQSALMLFLGYVIYRVNKYEEEIRKREFDFWVECQSKIAAFRKEHKL